MTHQKASRTYRRRAAGAVLGVAVAVAATFAVVPTASADRGRSGGGVAWYTQKGSLACAAAPAVLTATTSRARGNNITHGIDLPTGAALAANVGSSRVYANWGFTFWTAKSKRLWVNATGSHAHILTGARYCAWL